MATTYSDKDGVYRVRRRRLFFDIETSPNVSLVWRTGYNLRVDYDTIVEERAIICIAYKWEDMPVQSLKWDKNQCDKRMLEKFIPIMKEADEIVAHNGDRFDEKWIRTRCLFHRLDCPPDYNSLDTLKAVRKYFYLNSNRLDYVCRFLGLEAKIETGGFQLWKDVTLNNDRKALRKMVEYCENDVVILQRVYEEIFKYIKHKTHFAILTGKGMKFDCPECASMNTYLSKSRTTAAGTLKRQMHCNDCGKYFTISDKVYRDKVMS